MTHLDLMYRVRAYWKLGLGDHMLKTDNPYLPEHVVERYETRRKETISSVGMGWHPATGFFVIQDGHMPYVVWSESLPIFE